MSSQGEPTKATKSLRDYGLVVGLLAVSGLAVATTQLSASRTERRVKETSEVYLLPPPEQIQLMSLGYRSATADVLWADTMVVQGFRMQENRRYSNVVPLLETIVDLDPTFRDPYLMADTLVTFQSVAAPVEEVRRVRALLEKGTRALPLDADVWLMLGQFTSFLAPSSYLTDPAEQERWRQEGLPYLERAVELSGADSSNAWLALGGGRIYRVAGERASAIRFYQKVLATTDDEELKRTVSGTLEMLLYEERTEGAKEHAQIVEEATRQKEAEARSFSTLQPEYSRIRVSNFTGLPRTAMLIMGPPFDVWQCAGGARSPQSAQPTCASSWSEWASRTLGRALGTEATPSPEPR